MRTEGTFTRTAGVLGRHVTGCVTSLLSAVSLAQPVTTSKTLDGALPLIIGHRGLPGLYPEAVIAGYQAAISGGTDALELALQPSSDGVLFACHNVYLSDTTDVAS